ncbi:hypothetical protein Q9233_010766 [Columba guinea]|nr:hypothetical protein Q9233_010766 [Columba guinea]
MWRDQPGVSQVLLVVHTWLGPNDLQICTIFGNARQKRLLMGWNEDLSPGSLGWRAQWSRNIHPATAYSCSQTAVLVIRQSCMGCQCEARVPEQQHKVNMQNELCGAAVIVSWSVGKEKERGSHWSISSCRSRSDHSQMEMVSSSGVQGYLREWNHNLDFQQGLDSPARSSQSHRPMGKSGSRSADALVPASSSRSLLKLTVMEVKWIHVLAMFFFLLSVAMTGCFLWQYSLPKVEPKDFPKLHKYLPPPSWCSDPEEVNIVLMEYHATGVQRTSITSDTNLGLSVEEVRSEAVQMCPRYPEPVPLDHPIPILKDALEKVDMMLRQKIHNSGLPAMSAIVIYNDTVLWTGNFGKKNGSDPSSVVPNEYTIYRIASVSKIFPTIMLYKMWEEGKVTSLDDPLERYAQNFVIKNPLGRLKESEQRYTADGLIFLEKGSMPLKPSPVTLRRMASQLSDTLPDFLLNSKSKSAVNCNEDFVPDVIQVLDLVSHRFCAREL